MESILAQIADPSVLAPVIEVCAVSKRFGAVQAVDGVDLVVGRGELFGLIGHNGAGKSTLFKMMLGLLPTSSGEIRIDSEAVTGPGFRAVRRKIGYLPENVVLYDNLTGIETLHFFADLKGADKRECGAALERVGLAKAASRRVREYSKGMRQRLGFAQALLGKPQILFLDEPTSGLDPEAIREFYAVLRGLRDEGVTMILTSHILAEIQERVDRLAIIKNGKLQAVGTVQSLRERMKLPLTIELARGAALRLHIERLLEGLPVGRIEVRGEHLLIQIPREAKLPALARLTREEEGIDDLHVREPSLEDVFFGFSD